MYYLCMCLCVQVSVYFCMCLCVIVQVDILCVCIGIYQCDCVCICIVCMYRHYVCNCVVSKKSNKSQCNNVCYSLNIYLLVFMNTLLKLIILISYMIYVTVQVYVVCVCTGIYVYDCVGSKESTKIQCNNVCYSLNIILKSDIKYDIKVISL